MKSMQLEKGHIDPLECTGCGACELACSFHKDEVFTTIRSSIMIEREEKRNYFGMVIKITDDLIMGKPEGVELGTEGSKEGKPSAKPVLMREECDLCGGEPLCAIFCPTGAIKG
jgi:ferredoxin